MGKQPLYPHVPKSRKPGEMSTGRASTTTGQHRPHIGRPTQMAEGQGARVSPSKPYLEALDELPEAMEYARIKQQHTESDNRLKRALRDFSEASPEVARARREAIRTHKDYMAALRAFNDAASRLQWAYVPEAHGTLGEIIRQVPDVNDTVRINYWVRQGDDYIYLEGWCDKCLAGTGFPRKGRLDDEKLEYIKGKTNEILVRKGKEHSLTLVRGGFVERPEATHLYGVTYGVFRKPKAI